MASMLDAIKGGHTLRHVEVGDVKVFVVSDVLDWTVRLQVVKKAPVVDRFGWLGDIKKVQDGG